jgi:hypothetical protein
MSDRTAGDRGRRLRRFLLGALIAAALAVAMSGCALLKSVTSTQLNTIGNVQITSIICAGDTNSNNTGYNPADSACQGSTKGGNINQDAAGSNYQISLAYRVSNAVSGPSSFTSTNTSNPPTTPCGSGVTFNQNAGLATAIQGLSPAGSGKKWIAYYSTTQNYTTSGCQYLTVAPQFTLGQSFGVVPFQGPFNYRTIVGWRQVDEATPGNTSSRAATCGSTAITSSYNDGVDGTDSDTTPDMLGICADDPTPAVISGADASQPTRDLGVIPSSNGTAHAGGSGTVSFNARYNGAALPSGNFTLSATTNIAGATATPSPTTLNPIADSDNNVNVNVSVPAGTTPGDYNVFLFATLGSEQRGGIAPATLTVGQNFTFDPAPTLPSLGTITLNGQAQNKTAQMSNFGVNDTSASPSGWNVTVAGDSTAGKSAVFKQYCSNGVSACGSDPANSYVSGGRTLPANSLTLNSTGASWTSGTGSPPTFQCGGGSCAIDVAAATKIASAANGSAGTGLWTTSGFSASSVKLSTASTLRALPANEIYRLNVVWSLNSGP